MPKRLKVGDLVAVIAGDHKGKTGRLARIIADEDRVIVEGVNGVTRHQRPNARNQKGGKITKEAPIHASNVMPVDPKTEKPTRVKMRKAEGDTKKARVGKSGAELGAG